MFNINNLDLIEKINKVEYWYDKYTKSWVVQRKNKYGNQIGRADYVYSKKEALDLVKKYRLDI